MLTEEEKAWWHLLLPIIANDHDIISRVHQYSTDELKRLARKIAQMEAPLQSTLTLLGLPKVEGYWSHRVLPAIQREINRRENPPKYKFNYNNKPELLATVQEHVTLTHRGNRWWGICPFHDEETASFVVDVERQKWRCFGACLAGGDSIDFMRRMRSGGRTPRPVAR